MNSASPLIPQGSNLEQQSKARASLKTKIFCALGVNVAVLLGLLLMPGCKREPAPQPEDPNAYNANYNAGVYTESNPPGWDVDTNQAGLATDTNQPIYSTTATPISDPVAPPNPLGGEVAGSEYTVQKGDTFSSIAPKFHVTVKALQAANPTVDPAKLQIGKKLVIPPPTAPTTATGATPVVDTATGVTIHTVKSGDTLGALATTYHTTVKAIQAANGLTDSKIKVGQQLKIPAK